jgi:hypothetical protein
MHRRYNRLSRFDQPDPWDGSYNPTDPQSFNRYSYTQNDRVNFVDPTGLEPCTEFDQYGSCISRSTEEPLDDTLIYRGSPANGVRLLPLTPQDREPRARRGGNMPQTPGRGGGFFSKLEKFKKCVDKAFPGINKEWDIEFNEAGGQAILGVTIGGLIAVFGFVATMDAPAAGGLLMATGAAVAAGSGISFAISVDAANKRWTLKAKQLRVVRRPPGYED